MPLRLSRFGRRSGGRRFGSRRRGYKKFPRKMRRSSFRKRRNYSRKRRFGSRRRRYQGKLMGTYNRTFPTYTSIGGKNSVSIRGRECLGYIRSMNTTGTYADDDNALWPAYVPENDFLIDSGKIRAGLQGYAITCRNGTLLSKLSDYSKLYDKYYVKSITFQYIPAVSTQTPGNVFMYWEPNPLQPPVGKWTSKESFPALFARNATNSFTQVFGPMQMKVPIARKWNYTYSSQLGVDRFCDYGYLWVYCSHNTGTATSVGVGTLYCSYDIVLKFPSVPHTISGTSVSIQESRAVAEAEPERESRRELVPAMELGEVLSSNVAEVNDLLEEEVNALSRDAENATFIDAHRSQVWRFLSDADMVKSVSAHLQRMRQYVDDIRPDLTPLMVFSTSTTPRSATVRLKPLCYCDEGTAKFQSPLLNQDGFSPDTKTCWDMYGCIPYATMDGLMLEGQNTVGYQGYSVHMVYNLDDLAGFTHVWGDGTVNTNVKSSVSTRCSCVDSGPFVKVILPSANVLSSSSVVYQEKLDPQGQQQSVDRIEQVEFGYWSSLLAIGASPGNSLYCLPMKTMKFVYPRSDRGQPRRILYHYRYLDGAGKRGWTTISKEPGQLYKDFDREQIKTHGPVIDFTFLCVSQASEETWSPSECLCVVFCASGEIMGVDELLL